MPDSLIDAMLELRKAREAFCNAVKITQDAVEKQCVAKRRLYIAQNQVRVQVIKEAAREAAGGSHDPAK
jgi:hypothetical protein